MSKPLLIVVALGACASAYAAELPRYQALDIGTLGGKSSIGLAINEAGQITGLADTLDGQTHAFLYADGRMTDLGTFGGFNSLGRDINEAGQITGTAETADGQAHAFLYSNGTLINLGELPGGCCSDGTAINESGQVAGFSFTSGDVHAFLYKNGAMSDLGTLNGHQSVARGINDTGEVIGNFSNFRAGHEFIRPFVYRDGAMLDLGSLGGDFSTAVDINESGQVVGTSLTSDSPSSGHAFLHADGTVLNLGTLGGRFSEARALNDAGEVVGASTTKNGASHAFLFNQGLMVDLGAMLGEMRSIAWDINNLGQVVGDVIRPDGRGYLFVYADGEVRNVHDLIAGLFPRPARPNVLITGAQLNRVMNDRGQIVARVDYSPVRSHAVLLTPISLLYEQLNGKVVGAALNESLLNKVRESSSHYSAGRKPGACSKLQVFILRVESLQVTSIPAARRRDLLARARAIRQAVGCS